ncbi:MAG: sigma-70 family RNA polymerase sigma factor [Clostridiales bacterium]|nr:sigma-70 family RNA polymerase sigma factor [Clostridiales bacterium]
MSRKVVISGICTSQLPKMTAQECEVMLKRIKNGETHLRSAFIEGNMRLVLSMVQRFRTDKVSYDDLFQVGMLGLIKALDNFNIDLNVRFSTYAVPMILGEIRRYIRESTAMKVGRGIRDIAYQAMLARERLEHARENEVTLTEIAAEINIPYQEVVSALDAISDPVSIYESAYNDGEETVLVVDQISDDSSEDELLNRITLSDEVKKLPEREREIILLRYYQGKTQMEISNALSMSQAQVSRLEKNAIARLRQAF